MEGSHLYADGTRSPRSNPAAQLKDINYLTMMSLELATDFHKRRQTFQRIWARLDQLPYRVYGSRAEVPNKHL